MIIIHNWCVADHPFSLGLTGHHGHLILPNKHTDVKTIKRNVLNFMNFLLYSPKLNPHLLTPDFIQTQIQQEEAYSQQDQNRNSSPRPILPHNTGITTTKQCSRTS